MFKRILLVLAGFTCVFNASAETRNTVYKNPQSGLLTFTSESEGFSVEFIQLLPDFIRAIYTKHNIPDAQIERIARQCVFGSIIKNTSQQLLSYRVADWYYTDADGNRHPVKTKTQWLEEWRRAGVTFSWTLLPDSGDFEIGDWQQGFTTVDLPRDSVFDFTYTWKLDGVEHSATIENMSCAPASLGE